MIVSVRATLDSVIPPNTNPTHATKIFMVATFVS